MKYVEVRILLRLDDETKMDSMEAFNTAVGAFDGVVTAEVREPDMFLRAAAYHEQSRAKGPLGRERLDELRKKINEARGGLED